MASPAAACISPASLPNVARPRRPPPRHPPSQHPPSPSNQNRHVIIEGPKDEYKEQRSRILTMKYGKQQQMLIRKRLKVEMWMMDAVEVLYEHQKEEVPEIDIDMILDLESLDEKKKYILKSLDDCAATDEEIVKFVRDFLEQLKTL